MIHAWKVLCTFFILCDCLIHKQITLWNVCTLDVCILGHPYNNT